MHKKFPKLFVEMGGIEPPSVLGRLYDSTACSHLWNLNRMLKKITKHIRLSFGWFMDEGKQSSSHYIPWVYHLRHRMESRVSRRRMGELTLQPVRIQTHSRKDLVQICLHLRVNDFLRRFIQLRRCTYIRDQPSMPIIPSLSPNSLETLSGDGELYYCFLLSIFSFADAYMPNVLIM